MSTPNTVDTKIKFLELETRLIKIEKPDGSKTSFYAYKTFLKNGKKMDLKFTKEVKNAPTEDCMISVNADNMNIDRNRKYPLVWVKKIEEILPVRTLKHTAEDYKEIDDSFNTADDLPF